MLHQKSRSHWQHWDREVDQQLPLQGTPSSAPSTQVRQRPFTPAPGVPMPSSSLSRHTKQLNHQQAAEAESTREVAMELWKPCQYQEHVTRESERLRHHVTRDTGV